MIRAYLDCGCVFVCGFLTKDELDTGYMYCPEHKYLSEHGFLKERRVRIVKAYELRHPGYNKGWAEYRQVYPTLNIKKKIIDVEQLETV